MLDEGNELNEDTLKLLSDCIDALLSRLENNDAALSTF